MRPLPSQDQKEIRCFCFGVVWSTVIRFDPELFRCMCKKCNGYLASCLNLVFGWRDPLVQHSSSRTPFAKYSKGLIFAHTVWLRLLFLGFFSFWCYCQTSHKTYLLQLILESVPKPQFRDYCKLHLVVNFYLTLCQLFSLSCSTMFRFSQVPSSRAFLEGFWYGKVEGTGNSCREDAEWGKERVIWSLEGWTVGRFEKWGIVA